jgi:hypothetical protein
MNDRPGPFRSASEDHEPLRDYQAVDLVTSARNRIAALLNHDDELHMGMAIFALWAAFDELVDPLNPPHIGHAWFEDVGQSMRDAHTELVRAIAKADDASEALAIGRAAGNVVTALASYEHHR